MDGAQSSTLNDRKFDQKVMDDTPIAELIERLRLLQIETARTIELLEIARNDEDRRRSERIARANPVAVGVEARANTRTYRPGDRVIISNATRRNHSRYATVTRIGDSGRVHLLTDDNQITWRVPRNLTSQWESLVVIRL